MFKKGKAAIVLLLILAVISLGLAGTTFYFLQQEQSAKQALQTKLDNLQVKYKETEVKLEESRKTAARLESRITENELNIEAINKELQQEKSSKEEALSSMDQLKAELEQQRSQGSELQDKFNQVQKELKDKQSQLAALESKKEELESKIKELEEKSKYIELGKIVVSPDTGSDSANLQQENSAAQPKEGKVLVVNKEYDFAVINLGNQDTVKVGDEFSMYHNDAYIGDSKVEKVHELMASVGFLSDGIKEQISEGDKVVLKK